MTITTCAKKIKTFMNTPETFVIELGITVLIVILMILTLLTGRFK